MFVCLALTGGHKWALFKKRVRAAPLGALLAHADGSLLHRCCLTLLRTSLAMAASTILMEEMGIMGMLRLLK
jgi:hypothetical protein